MKSRQNWTVLIMFLVVASLLLVACERPLPGGYNDPDAGSDQTAPDTIESVPGVDPDAYPAGDVQPAESAPPESEAYPAEAAGDQVADEAPPQPEEAVEETAPEGEPAAEEAAPETDTSAEEAPAVEAPAEEGASAEEGTPAEDAAAPEDDDEDTTATPGLHTVAAGENLYRIGLLYGINWLDLAEANGISDPAGLSVGQVLTIPSPEDIAAAAAAAEAAEAESAESASTEEAAEEAPPAEAEPAAEEAAQSGERPETYVVQAGDNLFRIGVELGIDYQEIVAANGIINNQITPGQILIIPPLADADSGEEAEESAEDADEAGSVGSEPAAEEITYVAQEGDTVYSVAFLHNIAWTELISANDLEPPYALELGQVLIIPAAAE
jgi:LysM repeat protein